MSYEVLVEQQRHYFASGVTHPYAFRIAQLKKLEQLLIRYTGEIESALKKDLHKLQFEAWAVEVGPAIQETRYAIRHLRKWMRNKRLRTPLLHFRAKSYIQSIPHGNTLIIAPWNYPFLLSIRPLIGAIAGGNTAIIKPSEHAVHTSALLEQFINLNFASDYIHVIQADAQGTSLLLREKFDFIFYTGGSMVGKIVYTAAAQHLTPVVLELGGKNPCVIEPGVDIDTTVNRIVWGKFSNAGQTCVAPDYLLVHASIREQFTEKICARIKQQFSENPESCVHFGRIINQHHTERIQRLLAGEKCLLGGRVNIEERYIEPTVIDIQRLNSPIMQEEIFGPILPIITYHDAEEVLDIIQHHPNPLVFYVFSRDADSIKRYATYVSCGDMVINEVVLHFGHLYMPIGGKGTSGIGKYQGKSSFTAFTHPKSVMHRSFFPDLSIRYAPYTDAGLRRIKQLFRYFYR